ncbi:MAG: hypothetical protein MHM6MM_008775 [Cercozoa sp. M6MM]
MPETPEKESPKREEWLQKGKLLLFGGIVVAGAGAACVRLFAGTSLAELSRTRALENSLRPLKKDVNKIQSDLHTLRSDIKSDITKIQSDLHMLRSDVKRLDTQITTGFYVSKVERQHELVQLKSELQQLFFEQKIDDVRQQARAGAVTPATGQATDESDPSHTKPE